MCRLGSAWKPPAKLGFFQPRPSKTKAWAVVVGLGQLRLGLGLGHGLWEKRIMWCHTLATQHWHNLNWWRRWVATIATHNEWQVMSCRAQDTSNIGMYFFSISFDVFTNYIFRELLYNDDDEEWTPSPHTTSDKWWAAGPKTHRLMCPEPLVYVFFQYLLFFLPITFLGIIL